MRDRANEIGRSGTEQPRSNLPCRVPLVVSDQCPAMAEDTGRVRPVAPSYGHPDHISNLQSYFRTIPRHALVLPAGLLCVLVCTLGADPPTKPAAKTATPALPPLNAKVLAFAKEKVGEKVLDGQCTSLARAAIRAAGARRFPFEGGGDFVWGEPVPSFRDALPGDVLQFRDAVFEGKRYVTKRRWVSWREEYHHHTAIVAEVRERGTIVVVLHQNVGPTDAPDSEKKIVQEGTLRTNSLKEGGKVWIYRPMAPSAPAETAEPDGRAPGPQEQQLRRPGRPFRPEGATTYQPRATPLVVVTP
jgi:hypothetical protein